MNNATFATIAAQGELRLDLTEDSRARNRMQLAMTLDQVCAIIVTFHPDDEFPSRLEAIQGQVKKVFIVDNGSGEASKQAVRTASLSSSCEVIWNKENRGLAAALNQGIAAALGGGFDWAVTFDQDSVAGTQMVSSLLETLAKSGSEIQTALVGSNYVYPDLPHIKTKWLRPKPNTSLLFQRVDSTVGDLTNVTMVITSGALTNLQVCRSLGFFWEDLFIDYVDTEYCLRARRAGYGILVSHEAVLKHRLGAKQERRFLFTVVAPTFHSPSRLYYIARNRIAVMRRHGVAFPHWVLFDLMANLYNLLRVLLLENQRGKKMRAVVLGTLDGLANRLGPHNGLLD